MAGTLDTFVKAVMGHTISGELVFEMIGLNNIVRSYGCESSLHAGVS